MDLLAGTHSNSPANHIGRLRAVVSGPSKRLFAGTSIIPN